MKSNLLLYSLYYTNACNEFARYDLRVVVPGNTTLFKEMLKRWRAVSSTVSDLTARDLNLRPPAPETNVLPLDQLAG